MSGSPDPGRFRAPPGGAAAVLPLLLVAFVAAFPLPARGQDFSIRAFRADIAIGGDSSLRVTETIETVFHRPRYGLYRDIPFRYTDELGRTTVMPIEGIEVKNADGLPWNHTVSRTGGFLRIRIGDPDVYVDGLQVYVISYTVENGILSFPEHDELYWNVTGNGWPAEIGAASATVTVSGADRPLALRTRCFTGPRGSREQSCSATVSPDGAAFSATTSFGPGEGLTIVLGWDKGFVRPPSRWRSALFALDPHGNWALPLPLLTFGIMLFLWYRKGRDPDPGDPLVVAYAPPEEGGRPLTPAETGALLDERLDPADITASVVHLAVTRHLTIEERKTPGVLFDKTDYVLRREKEPDAALPPFERLLLARLFTGRGPEVRVSELKLEFYRHIEELKKAAFESLRGMRYFTANPMSVESAYIRTGIAFLAAVALLGMLGAKLGAPVSVRTLGALALSSVVVLAFARFMPVKTPKGARALGRVRGFQEFLLRAEKDRLERMNDPNLFEKCLPYAIALGVADRWAKAFEGIGQEPPRWYVSGGGPGAFRPASFHSSLDSALVSLSHAMYAAPRGSGSGFSGGGGSGGGGGGGGGGSW